MSWLHVYTYEGCQIHSSNSLGEKENQSQLRLEPQDYTLELPWSFKFSTRAIELRSDHSPWLPLPYVVALSSMPPL